MKRWKPKEGESYWYVDLDGFKVEKTEIDGWDCIRRKEGNCFETKKEARIILKDIKRILRMGMK